MSEASFFCLSPTPLGVAPEVQPAGFLFASFSFARAKEKDGVTFFRTKEKEKERLSTKRRRTRTLSYKEGGEKPHQKGELFIQSSFYFLKEKKIE